ncbi:MAG TPA: hypothetical protein VFC19_45060 [Candidatus Limnocylindrales bacterium]|nr:hypothetical protein [Candidatus Limnocylindrales bacterium]
MNQSPDSTRSTERIFTAYSVYCLLFALTLPQGHWQAGMKGSAVAYGCAVLHLVIVRRWGSRDG